MHIRSSKPETSPTRHTTHDGAQRQLAPPALPRAGLGRGALEVGGERDVAAPALYLLMSTSVETPIAMLPKASCRVFDWSAFDMPMSSQMFSSIGVTLAVCPAQYCGFAAARARTLGCCREVICAWISRDSLSDAATARIVRLRSLCDAMYSAYSRWRRAAPRRARAPPPPPRRPAGGSRRPRRGRGREALRGRQRGGRRTRGPGGPRRPRRAGGRAGGSAAAVGWELYAPSESAERCRRPAFTISCRSRGVKRSKLCGLGSDADAGLHSRPARAAEIAPSPGRPNGRTPRWNPQPPPRGRRACAKAAAQGDDGADGGVACAPR